jgi:hypothetical protein
MKLRTFFSRGLPLAWIAWSSSCGGGGGGARSGLASTASTPSVSDTVPGDGELAVLRNRALTVTFDRAMSPVTVNETTFLVTTGASTVDGQVSYDAVDHVATFVPSAPLAADTTFVCTLARSVADASGAPLATSYSWPFTTGAALDVAAPRVTATVPARAAFGVAPNRRIAITFDEPMDAESLTTNTVRLVGPGNVAVSGAVTYAGTTALFVPDALLASNSVYTASVTTGAKDLAGNALAATHSFSFTTGSTDDVTPPATKQALFTTTDTDVATNSKIELLFDEPLDPTTLTSSRFTVSRAGGAAIPGTVACVGDLALFTAKGALPPNASLVARVTGAADLAGRPLDGDFVWAFRTGPSREVTPPRLLSVSPIGGATDVALNRTVVVAFDEALDPFSIHNSTFTLESPGPTLLAGTVRFDAPSRTATFVADANLPALTQLTARLHTTARDLAGNGPAADVVWSFTTGQQLEQRAPRVVATVPAAGATSVALDHALVATFSTAMDAASLDASRFVLTGPVATLIQGSVSVDGSAATFTPSGPLAPSTTYTATIKAAAASTSGVALGSDKVWTFTTGSSGDTTAPTVVATVPTSNASGVAVNQSIGATFSEPLSPHRVSVASFKVATSSGTAVTGRVTLDPTGTIATFTPDASLAANTQYTATLSLGIGDLAGNLLGTDRVWTFTTDSHSLQSPVALATAASFGVLATSTITNSGTNQVGGDVGLSPGTAQGLPASRVNGSIHLNDAVVTGGQTDSSSAYQSLASRAGATALGADLANTTLTPGLYKRSSNLSFSSGTLTLDAQGDADALFLIQVSGTFTVSKNTQVVLLRGAKASNVFWQVSSTVLVDTNALFSGTVLAGSTITVNSGASVDGRLFAGATGASAAVNLTGATVTAPAQ